DEADLLGRQLGVDHDRNAARPHGAKHDLEKLDPIERNDRNAVAVTQAGADQPACNRVASRIEGAEADLPGVPGVVEIDDRDAVALPPSGENLAQIAAV